MKKSSDEKEKSFTKEEVYIILLKHYKISIADIRRLTSYEQGLMIKAIVEKISVGGKLYFETQAEYEKWLSEQQRNRKTERR